MTTSNPSFDHLMILSKLLFSGEAKGSLDREPGRKRFDDTLALANSHHVVMRCMEMFRKSAGAGSDPNHCQWATNAIEQERTRIDRALAFLRQICEVLGAAGCEVVVIKSLDHYPDLGSDLDLYTKADPADVVRVMTEQLEARVAARSWGDRLANKWNFIVPGLPELVEIHVGRLGQTGELDTFAQTLSARARQASVGPYLFRVPAAVDRLMICTLQRMYRHFYIRLCDIADTAQLLEAVNVDYADLQESAQQSGVWGGVATFLTIVSDYVSDWREKGIELPASVRSAAQFGADQIEFAGGFLRVPIVPHSARLYASEWKTLVLRGEVRSTARLSLLPWLATAAALGQKITGSDKGIW